MLKFNLDGTAQRVTFVNGEKREEIVSVSQCAPDAIDVYITLMVERSEALTGQLQEVVDRYNKVIEALRACGFTEAVNKKLEELANPKEDIDDKDD